MTDQTDAPERIYAQDAKPDECNFIGGGWWDDSCGNTQYPHIVEYVRSDILDAAQAEIAKLREALLLAKLALPDWHNGGNLEDQIDAALTATETF
jgi:hypothetical protein